MEIKFLRQSKTSLGFVPPGCVAEFPEDEAREMIRNGVAELHTIAAPVVQYATKVITPQPQGVAALPTPFRELRDADAGQQDEVLARGAEVLERADSPAPGVNRALRRSRNARKNPNR